MQLTLSSPQGLRPAHARPVPLRTLAVPWRDSASAQLDTLAATHRPSADAGRRWLLLAAVSAAFLVVLALTWRAEPAQPPARVVAAQGPVGVVAAAPSARSSVPVEPAAEAPRVATAEPAAPRATLPPPQDQRVGPPAESSRKAVPVAKARPPAADTAVRQALARVDDTPQAVDRADRVRQSPVAEESPRSPAAPAAPEALRSVSEVCAGAGGFIAVQFCRTRECRKSGQQNDPICVRQRDIEEAQLRNAAER